MLNSKCGDSAAYTQLAPNNTPRNPLKAELSIVSDEPSHIRLHRQQWCTQNKVTLYSTLHSHTLLSRTACLDHHTVSTILNPQCLISSSQNKRYSRFHTGVIIANQCWLSTNAGHMPLKTRQHWRGLIFNCMLSLWKCYLMLINKA